MKKILLLFFLMIITSHLHSQGGQWFYQNALPTPNNLYDVDFVNDNVGYAVSEIETVIKTTNGGINWFNLHSIFIDTLQGYNYDRILKKVDFFNVNTGYAIAYYGAIYKTTDAGKTWILNSDDSLKYYGNYSGIQFLNSNTGFVAGNFILKTTNGGNTWSKVTTPLNSYPAKFHALSPNEISFVGFDKVIFKTINGGASWIAQDTLSLNYYYVDEIIYTSNENGYILCATDYDTRIYRTTNGGTNWNGEIIYNQYAIWSSLCFQNKNTGFLVGGRGLFHRTTNGGLNWEKVPYFDTVVTLHSVKSIGEGKLITVGNNGNIYKSTDYGLNWDSCFHSLTDKRLRSVSFKDVNTGITVGDNGIILRTSNGGFNWAKVEFGSNSNMIKTKMFIDGTSYIIRSDGGIYKSLNDGGDWENINVSQYIPFIEEASFLNSNNFILVGGDPKKIIRTSDKGATWSSQTISQYIYNVQIAGFDKYIANKLIPQSHHSPKHAVAQSTNGGVTWYSSIPQSDRSQNIHIIDSNEVFITRFPNSYYITSNFFKSIEVGTYPVSVFGIGLADFLNSDIALSEGLRMTLDGGRSWHNIQYVNPLNDIDFIDVNTAVGVGDNGVIIRSNDINVGIGVDPTGTMIPASFSLSQNYPNPFNPSTKISFDIPVRGEVKLAVYNAVGQEVAVLVNQYLNAGKYQYSFDGLGLPTGVYFYRLVTDGFSQTKKMVLVK